MLWRVRTTMPDRPGSLAVLARHCGERGVNILGLQIFPGVQGVTDELVLRAPDDWRIGDVAALVEDAGGTDVTVGPSTEHALVDGPIQYLHALRRRRPDPSTLPEMLRRRGRRPRASPHLPDPVAGAPGPPASPAGRWALRSAAQPRLAPCRRTLPGRAP